MTTTCVRCRRPLPKAWVFPAHDDCDDEYTASPEMSALLKERVGISPRFCLEAMRESHEARRQRFQDDRIYNGGYWD